MNDLNGSMQRLANFVPREEKLSEKQIGTIFECVEEMLEYTVFHHVKSGGSYEYAGVCLLHQNSETQLAIQYVPLDEQFRQSDVVIHTRPVREFFDGRFVFVGRTYIKNEGFAYTTMGETKGEMNNGNRN